MSDDTAVSFEQQYHALRRGCGFVELSNWSSVTVSGDDRSVLLHNFCTNDIKRLAAGECCEAFFTNVKGRIVMHGVVSCREHELVVVGVPRMAPALIEHIDRYVIREDVKLRDTSAERCYLLVAGASAARERFAAVFPNHDLRAADAQVISWNLVGSDFASVLEVHAEEVPNARTRLCAGGFVLAERAFSAARIEAGVPLFMNDFNERNFPQEVGRDREAISFTKGCYLGQETVARIDALGHVNQRIVGVHFFGSKVPAPGTELLRDGAKVGRVTSAAFSPRFSSALALAMVQREANSPGTRLESPIGACEVVALPVSAIGS